MTLQQLRYIIAIDRHRNFARAALELGITQPTLSSLLQKLETELDVRIFERTNKGVSSTAIGEKIVRQAKVAVSEADRIIDMIAEERGAVDGKLNLTLGPTIAPYLLPRFINVYVGKFPGVELSISEMKTDAMLRNLMSGNIDIGIAVGGHQQDGVSEIPLYKEPFWVYMSEDCMRRLPAFRPEDLEHRQMWVMKEAQCFRDSAFSFCKAKAAGKHIYEAGSIDTLIRIVDANGGFTIIPEMHLPMLTERQRGNVRRIDGEYLSYRKISIYIRSDYFRERLLNSVVDALKIFIPAHMLEPRLLKFGIKL